MGRTGRRLNPLNDLRGILAIGDIGRHAVVEQHDLLPHHGNLSAQIRKPIVADVDSVHQNPAGLRLIEARQQVHQGCLAAPRTAHQGDGLARFDGKINPLQHLTLGRIVSETQPFETHRALGSPQGLLAAIRLGIHLQQGEDAAGGGDTPLQGCIDCGELFHGSEQAHHGPNESRECTRRHRPGNAVIGGDVNNARHGDGCDELDHRVAGGLSQRPFHDQRTIVFVDLFEASGFIILGTEHLGQSLTFEHLFRSGGEFAHRVLDAGADAAESMADPANQYGDHGTDQYGKKRQLGVEVKHQPHETNDFETVADHDRDGLGRRIGHLIHIKRQTGQQLTGRIAIVERRGQTQKMIEQFRPYGLDHSLTHIGHVIV